MVGANGHYGKNGSSKAVGLARMKSAIGNVSALRMSREQRRFGSLVRAERSYQTHSRSESLSGQVRSQWHAANPKASASMNRAARSMNRLRPGVGDRGASIAKSVAGGELVRRRNGGSLSPRPQR